LQRDRGAKEGAGVGGRRGKGGIRGLDMSGKAERGGHERYMCWVGREQSSEDGIQDSSLYPGVRLEQS